MTFKIVGAICILFVCGGFGYYLAWQHLREERFLRQLICVLDYMECELQYRLTPLPDLCRSCAGEISGPLNVVFLQLAAELEKQVLPDVDHCMKSVVPKVIEIPALTRAALEVLGHQLGRFDLTGQVRCLDSVRSTCYRYLDNLCNDKEMRVRRYKTLGICAGAALIIIFI